MFRQMGVQKELSFRKATYPQLIMKKNLKMLTVQTQVLSSVRSLWYQMPEREKSGDCWSKPFDSLGFNLPTMRGYEIISKGPSGPHNPEFCP